MKKLCAFIVAFTASISVFACHPFISLTPAITSSTITEKTVDDADNKIITYICNKNTKKFHLPSCCTLPKEKNRVYISSYERAINRGFAPCKNCNP